MERLVLRVCLYFSLVSSHISGINKQLQLLKSPIKGTRYFLEQETLP